MSNITIGMCPVTKQTPVPDECQYLCVLVKGIKLHEIIRFKERK